MVTLAGDAADWPKFRGVSRALGACRMVGPHHGASPRAGVWSRRPRALSSGFTYKAVWDASSAHILLNSVVRFWLCAVLTLKLVSLFETLFGERRTEFIHDPGASTHHKIMKSAALWSLLLWGGLSSACGGHGSHDDKEWTKQELDELEEKWGFEVSILHRGGMYAASGPSSSPSC